MMRQPLKTLLAVLLAAALAAGCGSDDDASNAGGNGNGGGAENAESPAQRTTTKAKRSARAEMVKCMEDAGFQVSHEGDEEKATNYTIEAGGSKKAEIIIHSNKNDAAGSARRAGEEKGLNSIPFGRTEFRRADAATDREAGVLANCVAEAYVH